MIRTLVFLLVALPMLVPPGMCICQFDLTGRCSPAAVRVASAPEQASSGHERTPRSSCCCRHRKGGAAEHLDRAGGLASEGGPGIPAGREHAPGCPAARSLDYFKVERNINSVAPPADLAGFFALPAIPARQALLISSPAQARPALPVYLTLCTLLI